MPKRYRQRQVKDLPKATTWRLEWDSNLRPSAQKAPNPPPTLTHHDPYCVVSKIKRCPSPLSRLGTGTVCTSKFKKRTFTRNIHYRISSKKRVGLHIENQKLQDFFIHLIPSNKLLNKYVLFAETSIAKTQSQYS